MERRDGETGRRITRSGGGGGAAPVLVALAFLLVVSLDLSGPGVRTGGRDAGHARMVARPLTEALARAVRGMVGVQTERPLARDRAGLLACRDDRRPVANEGAGREGPAAHHVRDGLLSLPPPGAMG